MAQIDSTLLEKLEHAASHEVFDVDIFLASEPAREVMSAGGVAAGETTPTYESIESRAYRSQEDLVGYLNTRNATVAFADAGFEHPGAEIIEQFWATNSVAARVTREVLRALMQREDVIAIQPARYASPDELEDGPKESDAAVAGIERTIEWGVTKVNAPLLWARGIDGRDVVVAVIDSGVNYQHDDLKRRMWQSGNPALPKHGFNFENNDDDPMDQSGHGTACAGIVAGDGTSGVKTGVAPGARIMALRVVSAERRHWAAMQFAMRHGAQVISMSITWKHPRSPNYPGWRRICEALSALGIAHANSAGNEGANTTIFPIPFNVGAPANCPPPRLHALSPIRGGLSSAVACGATDSSDALWRKSSTGPAEWNTAVFADYPINAGGLIKPDVCAPGPGVRSCNFRYRVTATQPYLPFGSTSAATPHVAGCMALLVQATQRKGRKPDPAEILEALEETAVRIPGQTATKENGYGAGRVDVYAAYQYGEALGWWS